MHAGGILCYRFRRVHKARKPVDGEQRLQIKYIAQVPTTSIQESNSASSPLLLFHPGLEARGMHAPSGTPSQTSLIRGLGQDYIPQGTGGGPGRRMHAGAPFLPVASLVDRNFGQGKQS